MSLYDFIQIVCQLLAGISILFIGGELFVQGAAALAIILKIPQLIIGLTVVSLGTSAPELFVSLSSLAQGSNALAVSNVIGSNIFNVMVVLGSSAIVLPLMVESRLVRRDVPILLVVSTAVWRISTLGYISWHFGLALLLFLFIYIIAEIISIKNQKGLNGAEQEELGIQVKGNSIGWINSTLRLGIGCIFLTFGSNLLVNGASAIAISLGVSEAIIGLTIVSVGTSLPELTTSLVAALRGKTDLAIGNVIGSCLLNQLLVLSLCTFFAKDGVLFVDQILINKDLPVMVIAILTCMPIFWTKGKISRLEGSALLGLYLLYIADQIIPLTLPSAHEYYRLTLISLVLPISIVLIIFKSISYWFFLNQKPKL